MKEVTVVIAGIGGYGNTILKNMLPNLQKWGIRLVGAADPGWAAAPLWPELEQLGVPHFDSLEEFYAQGKADLAILCTPIHFHESNAITAMENGSDVLCEKPVAATIPQAERMAQVAEKTGRNLHIGFQLSYVPSVWRLKQDIMDGILGKPISLSSLICWPRNSAYYARPWCAKLRKNGQYVLDSIAMNACAHYLHLMYFLLGSTMETAAMPESLKGILCRANPIETFDTAMLEIRAAGAKLQFMATHTCQERVSPVMRFVFENAVVDMTEGEAEDAITATFRDGTVKKYGPVKPDFFNKIPYCCNVIRGEAAPICTVETATPHLLTVDAVTELLPVQTLEGSKNEKEVTVVPGLDTLLKEAFTQKKMPWELTDRFGLPAEISLINYQWGDRI